MRVTWLFAATAGFFAAATPLMHASADEVKAISTPGKGNLTMCPDQLLYRTCNLYHHIKLPQQIAVGDTVRVRFGSNTKHYNFPIARILRDGGTCTVYSQLGETENVEKIEVASCEAAPGAQ